MSLPLVLLKLLHEAEMLDGFNIEYKPKAKSKWKITVHHGFTAS